MNTGSWFLGEELQSIVYRIISDSQKQPFEDVFQYRCSWKFRNIHRKISVLRSLFDKAAGLHVCNFLKKRPQHKCFPANIAILPPQASHPQQFSAIFAKYTLHDGTELDDDYFADNKKDESDTDTSDNESESGDNNDDVHTGPPKASRFDIVTWYGLL